jgi:hypothetical protein
MISQRLPGYFRRKTVLDLTGSCKELFTDCVYTGGIYIAHHNSKFDVLICNGAPTPEEVRKIKTGGLLMAKTCMDLTTTKRFEDEFPIGFHNRGYFWGIKTG